MKGLKLSFEYILKSQYSNRTVKYSNRTSSTEVIIITVQESMQIIIHRCHTVCTYLDYYKSGQGLGQKGIK